LPRSRSGKAREKRTPAKGKRASPAPGGTPPLASDRASESSSPALPAGIAAIRPAEPSDAPEAARLLTLLGHPTTAERILATWHEWTAAGNTALVAARDEGTLAGLVTLHRMTVLHRPHPVGRLTSLVVDEPDRGRGVGRALVAAAETWLVASGCGLLEVTSNVRRAEAHAFYEHLGYERTSLRFAKPIAR
jgi:GNAT superfamily N-acetyltransferase